MLSGVVKWFSSERGFGFISSTKVDEDVFVRYTGIEGEGFRSLEKGEKVEFEIAPDRDGKPEAVSVRRLSAP
ncbi:MAG: cold-shock protein [Acidobacteria bacterium]|nr:MAG: cold-shock protein [Acidobacteriota bacterium]